MAQVAGSKQLSIPSFLTRRTVGDSLSWLISQSGGRGSDRLTTGQMRSICDSQGVPSACKATLKHQVVGLDWTITDGPETDSKDIKDSDKGKHYYRVLRDMLDDGGNLVGFATAMDLFADDVLTARQGGCWEVIRDKGGVAQAVLHVDAGTIRFTHEPKRPVFQVSPWGEVSEVWEADRFGQARWHPNPQMGAALLNRTPIQLAYSAIAILSSSDSYNFKIIAEPIPAGFLNLGPGFNRDRALQWKASWDASMRGIQPEPIHVLYGTPQFQYQAFRPPPRDMAFSESGHWYASLVAACFEMSILDISILTRVATKAAAEMQAEATERQGLRHLMKKIKEAIEKYILEEGIFFHFEDISPKDEAVEAEIAVKETSRVVQAVEGKLITEEQGFDILQQLKHLPADMKYDAAEFEKRKQEAQEQFQQKQEAEAGGQQVGSEAKEKKAKGKKGGAKGPAAKKEVGKAEAGEVFNWGVEKKKGGFDPNQPRDDIGRWAETGAGQGTAPAKASRGVTDKKVSSLFANLEDRFFADFSRWDRLEAGIAEDANVDAKEVGFFRRAWTGGGSYARKLTMEKDAAAEFGITQPDWLKKRQKDAGDDRAGDLDAAEQKRVLGAIYERTQKLLKEKGISEVRVVRGLRLPVAEAKEGVGDKTRLEGTPLESWTTSVETAKYFAEHFKKEGTVGLVVESVMPAERILGIGFTGLGDVGESELIILGGRADEALVTFVEGA